VHLSEVDADAEVLRAWSFFVSAASFDHAMSTIFAKPQLRFELPREGTDPVVPRDIDRIRALTDRGQARDGDIEPPHAQGFPASPIDLEAVLLAVEHAPNEQAVMAIMKSFLDAVETAFPVDADPIDVVTTVFGIESAAVVAEVAATAVVALEAEAAATGGVITERASDRIASDMVRHVTTRAHRGMPRVVRARTALGVRIRRAPRARRAHRRAVRLSAVASAGDGPPPRELPAATRASGCVHVSLARERLNSALPIEFVRVRDTAPRSVEAAR
jgi:hypothetical protein